MVTNKIALTSVSSGNFKISTFGSVKLTNVSLLPLSSLSPPDHPPIVAPKFSVSNDLIWNWMNTANKTLFDTESATPYKSLPLPPPAPPIPHTVVNCSNTNFGVLFIQSGKSITINNLSLIHI
eukprot:TRINITY_DN22396_c0_g1_i1.p1 TRINITY_DN22396_c0_g1~~TRINITY_DN22396_c0_g1_i1.p1  ORF type:complete len:123 (-),score=7.96 TRINITY_DN22396_c0_g1_i1:26-394(-)